MRIVEVDKLVHWVDSIYQGHGFVQCGVEFTYYTNDWRDGYSRKLGGTGYPCAGPVSCLHCLVLGEP